MGWRDGMVWMEGWDVSRRMPVGAQVGLQSVLKSAPRDRAVGGVSDRFGGSVIITP